MRKQKPGMDYTEKLLGVDVFAKRFISANK